MDYILHNRYYVESQETKPIETISFFQVFESKQAVKMFDFNESLKFEQHLDINLYNIYIVQFVNFICYKDRIFFDNL